MPQSLETISRIVVVAEEVGLAALGEKYKQLTADGQAAAVAIKEGGNAAVRADRAYESHRRRMDELHGDVRKLEAAERTLKAAFAQGLLGSDEEAALARYNAELKQAAENTKAFKQLTQERAAAAKEAEKVGAGLTAASDAEQQKRNADALKATDALREQAAAVAKKQQAAIDAVNASLFDEQAKLTLTSEQYKLYNALKQAGVGAGSAEGQQIAQRVSAIEAEKNARIANSAALRDAVKAAEAEAAAEAKMAAEAREILQQINPATEAQKRLQQQLQRNKQIFDAGLFGKGAEGAENFAKANAHAEEQVRKATTSVGLSTNAIRNLGYQLNDIISGLASGQGIGMVATQQFGQVYQAVQGPHGVAQGFKDAGKWLLSLAASAPGVGVALAGAAYVAYKAWADFGDTQRRVEASLTGLGRAVALNAEQFDKLRDAAAQSGSLSLKNAGAALEAIANTGQRVSPENMVRLAAATKTFAATYTGGDLQQGMQKVADLIKSGPEGIAAEIRARKLLTPEIQQQLDKAERQRDINIAIDALLDSIGKKSADWNRTTSELGKAWQALKDTMSDIWTAMGPGIADFVKRVGELMDMVKSSGFLQAAGRGLGNISRGDLSNNPVSRAVTTRSIPMPSPDENAVVGPSREEAEAINRNTEANKENAKAKEQNKAATEAKAAAEKASVPATEKSGEAVDKLNGEIRSAIATLTDMRDNAVENNMTPNEWRASLEKTVRLKEALEGTDDAAKKAALTFSGLSYAEAAAAMAADDAKTKRQASDAALSDGTVAADKHTKALTVNIEKQKDRAQAEKDYQAVQENGGRLSEQDQEARAKNLQALTTEISEVERARKAAELNHRERLADTDAQREQIAVERAVLEQRGKEQLAEQTMIAVHEARREKQDAVTAAYRDANKELSDNQRLLDAEKGLLFASNGERDGVIARIQKENELRRAGRDLSSEEAKGIIARTEAEARERADLSDRRQLWEGVKDAASSAFTTIIQGFAKGEKSGDTFRKAIASLGDSLTSIGTKNLFSGASAGISKFASGASVGESVQSAVAGGLSTGNLVVAGIGAALSYFSASQAQAKAKKQKAAQDYIDQIQKDQEAQIARQTEEVQKQADALQKQVDLQSRISDYNDRLLAAQLHGNDSLSARLQLFDAQAARQRADEAEKGNGAIVQLEAALAQERLNILNDFNKEVLARSRGYQDRVFQATTDTEKLAGQLAAFDRAAAKERADEWERGGGAINDLEAALQAERLKIVRDYNKQVLDEQKSFWADLRKTIQKFIDDMRGGQNSPLSPLDRVAAAQGAFQTQFSMAGRGNKDALEGITGYATTLLDAARDAYASGAQFQNIYRYVLAALQSIQRMGVGGAGATISTVATTAATPVGTAANTNIPPAPVMAAPATTSDLMNEVRLLRSEVAAFRVENREGVARDTNVVHTDLETLADEIRSGSDRQARETRVAALRPKTGTSG